MTPEGATLVAAMFLALYLLAWYLGVREIVRALRYFAPGRPVLEVFVLSGLAIGAAGGLIWMLSPLFRVMRGE